MLKKLGDLSCWCFVLLCVGVCVFNGEVFFGVILLFLYFCDWESCKGVSLCLYGFIKFWCFFCLWLLGDDVVVDRFIVEFIDFFICKWIELWFFWSVFCMVVFMWGVCCIVFLFLVDNCWLLYLYFGIVNLCGLVFWNFV